MSKGSLTLLALGLGVLLLAPCLGAEDSGRARVEFSGEVSAGQSLEYKFGSGFRFQLKPHQSGWAIVIRDEREDENITRLTPPLHFLANPCDIAGWHFRNEDNTGPNEAGKKNINAPGEVREFIFSPEVGRTIQGPQANKAPTEAEIDQIKNFGRGKLTILDYRLADLEPGKKASFTWIRFVVKLSWPSWPAPSGCTKF